MSKSSPASDGGFFHANALAASLTVNDLQKSVAWYRDVVGFTVDNQYEREGKLMAVARKAGPCSCWWPRASCHCCRR